MMRRENLFQVEEKIFFDDPSHFSTAKIKNYN